jgi:hypothetical protein
MPEAELPGHLRFPHKVAGSHRVQRGEHPHLVHLGDRGQNAGLDHVTDHRGQPR